jgi:hypothetical protein
MRFIASIALATLISLGSMEAAAQDAAVRAPDPAGGAFQLRPSVLWSVVTGERSHGFGAGLELIRYPNASAWRWGFFTEAIGELEGAARVAGGFSFGYGAFGIQAGVAHRTEGDYAASTALQLAKTFTYGPAGIAFRLAIPLQNYQPSQGPALETRGVEMAVVVQLGWSFTLSGARPAHRCHPHGHADEGETPAAY